MNGKAPKPKQKPPRHLRKLTKAWFRSVVESYLLEPHHLKVLTNACEALDRAAEAREAISKDGAYVKNRFGESTKHPALTVERDCWIVFARLLRELDLDVEPPVEAKRPPALRSIGVGRGM